MLITNNTNVEETQTANQKQDGDIWAADEVNLPEGAWSDKRSTVIFFGP